MISFVKNPIHDNTNDKSLDKSINNDNYKVNKSEKLFDLLRQVKYHHISSQLIEKTTTKTNDILTLIKLYWTNGSLLLIMSWILWLIIGTIFYGIVDFNYNFSKGFYFAVNVGYSIGWGILKENRQGSYFFSTIYILIGATAISGWLAYLIESSLKSKQDQYYNLIHKQDINNTKGIKYYQLLLIGYLQERSTFLVIVWVIYVLFGTIWSCCVIGWTPIEGLYFSISTLSTGGLHGIPSNSPDFVFCFVGLYACTGIPVMGMAMGSIATSIVSSHHQKQIDDLINSKLTSYEIDFFKAINLSNDNSSNSIDRNEYILLTLVRLNMLDIDLISKINQRFKILDHECNNVLTYEDLALTVDDSDSS